MAIAFDAASNRATATSTSPMTWSHTCTGSDLVLVVTINQFSSSSTTTGVTYNGVAMTLVDAETNSASNDSMSMWVLFNPATGANTISVTFTGSTNHSGEAVSLSGVDSTVDATISGSGASNSISTNLVTVASNAWIVDGVALVSSAGNTVTVGGSQTDRVNGSFVNSIRHAMSTLPVPTPGSTNMSWTGTGTSPSYAHILVSFAPTGAAPSFTPTPMMGMMAASSGMV